MKIVVLAGGLSTERAVSLVTGTGICRALRDSGGNISEAARALNMSRQNLQYRIKRYQINIDELRKE